MSRSRPSVVLLLLLAAGLTLAACGGNDDISVDTGADLPTDDSATPDADLAAGGSATRPWIGGEWELISLVADGADVPVPAGWDFGLSIAGPDSISGSIGCNSFNGTIEAPFDDDSDGGPLTVGQIAATERACEILDFEGVYANALAAATRWDLSPPQGLVFSGDGVELVYTVAAPPAEVPLEGTLWNFDTIFDGEGVERTASTPRTDKPGVTAEVAAGVVTLVAEDCGPVEIRATYDADGSDGSFQPELDLSAVTCDDPESNLLTAAKGVAEATGFQIFDGRLTFIGLTGETVSFIAADG